MIASWRSQRDSFRELVTRFAVHQPPCNAFHWLAPVWRAANVIPRHLLRPLWVWGRSWAAKLDPNPRSITEEYLLRN